MRVTDRGSRDVEAAPQLQLHAGIAAGDDEHEPSPLTFGAAEPGQEADAAAAAPSGGKIFFDLNNPTPLSFLNLHDDDDDDYIIYT